MLADIDLSAAIPIALACVMGIVLIVGAFANWAHAANNEALADELDTAKEALDAAAHTLTKVVSGVPLTDALLLLPQDPEAVDVWKKTIQAFKRIVPVLLLALGLVTLTGCPTAPTKTHIEHLEKSLRDERRAVVVRPGFEAQVTKLRAAEDDDLAAIKEGAHD